MPGGGEGGAGPRERRERGKVGVREVVVGEDEAREEMVRRSVEIWKRQGQHGAPRGGWKRAYSGGKGTAFALKDDLLLKVRRVHGEDRVE